MVASVRMAARMGNPSRGRSGENEQRRRDACGLYREVHHGLDPGGLEHRSPPASHRRLDADRARGVGVTRAPTTTTDDGIDESVLLPQLHQQILLIP